MASKGKSTIDVEVNASALNRLVELAEKYRSTLEAANKLLGESVKRTGKIAGEQERVNKSLDERERRTKSKVTYEPKREYIPPSIQDPETKRFIRNPLYQPSWGAYQRRFTEPDRRIVTDTRTSYEKSQDFFASRKERVRPGSPQDRFQTNPAGFGRPMWSPPKVDERWQKPKVRELDPNTAEFKRLMKSNENWNKTFYQLFTGGSGRIGENVIKGMLSGNLVKMLGISGIAGTAAYALKQGAEIGAEQRLQALQLGGVPIGKMRAAQIELAQFGDVDPMLRAIQKAKMEPGSEEARGLRSPAVGLTQEQISTMDVVDIAEQVLKQSSIWAKSLDPIAAQSIGQQAQAMGLTAAFGGDPNRANVMRQIEQKRIDQAIDAIHVNAQLLGISDQSAKNLTDFNIAVNKAGGIIQTNFIELLGQVTPVLTDIINAAVKPGDKSLPAAIGMTPRPGGVLGLDPNKGIWVDNWRHGGDIHFGTIPDEAMRPFGDKPTTLKSPKNNPPLESSIYGSAAVGESDSRGVMGGMTRVGIFTPKIEKLNKDVIDTTKSLNDFNDQLRKGSQILLQGSGQYLADREKAKNLISGASSGTGSFIGGPIGTGISGGGGSVGGGSGGGGGTAGGAGGEAPASIGERGTGGAAARPAKGALKANQAEAYKAAIDSGLSDSSARALVANMSGEGLSTPGIKNWDRTHWARGIVQWDEVRSEAIKNKFGKYPNEMSVAEQTKAAIWEMQTNPAYKETWKSLQGGGSVEEKIGTLVRNYERPKDVSGAISTRVGFAKGLPSSIGGGATVGDGKTTTPAFTGGGGAPSTNMPDLSDSKDWASHLKEMKANNLLTDEQCVTLAMASVGVKKGSGVAGSNVHDWRRGESAEAGNLTKGMPISTFLNRQGGQSDLYAGGGIGTPGAHLDHAAVFDRYIKNNMGRITGMVVEEQYKGSKGVHEHEYDFGKGWGETDASNYSRIKLASGGYLGDETRRDVAARTGRDDKTASKSAPHIGDMSMFQQNQGVKLHINNPAGADVIAQTAMLGFGQGNFG